MAQIVTTSTGTTTLDATYESVILLQGTAAGCVIGLGAATGYGNTYKRKVVNGSSQSVTVQNSGATWTKTVRAGEEAECYLLDNSTAAGTWTVTIGQASSNHNDLANPQGGAAAEYYHFNAARYNDLLVGALTSADDTTRTLTTSDPGEIAVTGTGALYWIDLGDATTYSVAAGSRKRFKIHNSTPEFVGVKNGNSSVWVRLPPRATLEAILLTNSDANGTWHIIVTDPATFNPRYGMNFFDDGMGVSTGGHFWLGQYVSGTGATIGSNVSSGTNLDPTQYGQGVTLFTTGTTNAGSAARISGQFYFSGCASAYVTKMRPVALSTVAEEFKIQMGFHDSTTISDPTDAVCFAYDRATAGDFWRIMTANSGSRTTTTLADAVDATAYHEFRIEVSSGGGTGLRADFWIDKVLKNAAGGVTTNIPTTNARNTFVAENMAKSAGTTARTMGMEYTWVGRYPSVLR